MQMMSANVSLTIMKITHNAKNVHQNVRLVFRFLCASPAIILHKEHLTMARVFVMTNFIQPHLALHHAQLATILAKLV